MDSRWRVMVSGASSGIGKATAIRFARAGWDVCLTARREAELRSVYESLPVGHHLVCPADYTEAASVERAGEVIRTQWRRLDALVNCAGVSYPAGAITSTWPEWRRSFDILVDGAALLTRLAAPLMNDGGRIIHITSIHGERAERLSSSYGMAKAAINQYCRALAVELAPHGILVNAIAPGFVDTPMSVVDGVNELETEWFRANYVDGHHLPLRRAALPDEIAGVALFLAGPDASYITGQVLTVDGGLSITF